MGSDGVYANFFAAEGTVSVAVTVSLPWRSRRINVVNDSLSADLDVTMGGASFTLKPTETLSAQFWTTKAVVSGTNTPYRFWAWG